MAQLENIEAIEKRLWKAADSLRSNSNYASDEYFLSVIGLIFLRHAYSRYSKVKAAINVKGINNYRRDRDAINVVYKSLQKDRDDADISDIIRQLDSMVDDAMNTKSDKIGKPGDPYDISAIDFDRLRAEFARSATKRTTVQKFDGRY